MPTRPIDRLMFAQGNCCFFCRQPLPKEQATVEHLVALSNGGPNSDRNCVACCWTMNQLLGSRSLKEKFQVVLNQQGKFQCPNGVGSAKPVTDAATPSEIVTAVAVAAPPMPAAPPKPVIPPKVAARPNTVAPVKATAPPAAAVAKTPALQPNVFLKIVANLTKLGKARPKKLATLTNTVAALLKDIPDTPVLPFVKRLLTEGYVQIDGETVLYPKWEAASPEGI